MSDGYWYCNHCQHTVFSTHVTYEENHDTCGRQVEWVEDDKPTYAQLEAERDRLRELYHGVNRMMAILGAQGEINTRDAACSEVMSLLYDIDGGNYSPSPER